MNYNLLKLLAGFALLCSTPGLQAQTIFDVELVFFKRIGDLHLTGQQEPMLLESEDIQYQLSKHESNLPAGYTLLQRSEQRLEGVYRRLKVSSDMRPLLYIGWRQELKDKADTPWLAFNLKDSPAQRSDSRQADSSAPVGLEDFRGVIRLSRNQGLVLESQVVGYKKPPFNMIQQHSVSSPVEETDNTPELDLPFESASEELDNVENGEQFVEKSNADEASSFAQDKTMPSSEDVLTNNQYTFNGSIQMPDVLSGFFEMSETIKIQAGKLYYIDHPTMGLLVKVTPYQASLEEQGALN